MRSTQPQLSPDKYIPLLNLDTIERGLMIHHPNDLTQVHWQFTSYKVTGIDNEKQVLLCLDLDDKPVALPFDELPGYYVIKFAKGKKKKVLKRDVLKESSWDKK